MPVWVAFIPSPRQVGGMVRNDRQVPGRGQSVGTTTPELGGQNSYDPRPDGDGGGDGAHAANRRMW
jgi:hypothetical protein